MDTHIPVINKSLLDPLPARVKTVRRALGYTRKEWSAIFSITVATLRNYENQHTTLTLDYVWLVIDAVKHYLISRKADKAFIDAFVLFMYRGGDTQLALKMLDGLTAFKVTEEDREFGIFEGEVNTSRETQAVIFNMLPDILSTLRKWHHATRNHWAMQLKEYAENIFNWEKGKRKTALSFLLKLLYSADNDNVILSLHEPNTCFILCNYQLKRSVPLETHAFNWTNGELA